MALLVVAGTAESTTTYHYPVKAQVTPTPIESLSEKPTQEQVKQAINWVMSNNDLSKDFYNVAQCESGFTYYAYNPGGNSYGIFQYIPSTFKKYCNGDYKSPKAQILCAAQMFKSGLQANWDCFCQNHTTNKDCKLRGF